jgi:short-subunit dehydrogenase
MTNARPLALVTGASSGIGRSYAEALAARGYDLVLVARRADRLRDLAAKLSVDVEAVTADLGADEGRAAVADVCKKRPLDLLVNNAGVAWYATFAKVTPQHAEEVLRVNTLAVVALSRAAIEGMVSRGRGAIVNVASLLAFSGAMRGPMFPARAVYAGTKAFVVAFTQILATELEGTGVKAQVVCPGVVATEFHSVQGMDTSKLPRLSSDDLVKGALLDLDAGIVVSIPTLEDRSALDAIGAAEGALLGQTLKGELAPRYAK